MKNHITPNYLSNIIPEQTQNRYQLRNFNNIPIVNSRTQLYQDSFLPSVIRDWNNLPDEIKSSSTLEIFKSKLNGQLKKPPIYYFTGDRKAQILHTRLRLGCSSLNHDLFRKSIVNDSHCSCGNIETVNHYLLSCPNFQVQRNTFFANLQCPLTVQNLLYGSEHLNFEHNTNIFSCVQQYIVATKRFTS